MKLADLVKKQGGGKLPDAADAQAPTHAQGGDEQLRKAAAEVLRIFDTGIGNGGISASDWLMAMAGLRAALGQNQQERRWEAIGRTR